MNSKLQAFIRLGEVLSTYEKRSEVKYTKYYENLEMNIGLAKSHNPWFTDENIYFAFHSIGKMLEAKNIEKWLTSYQFEGHTPKTIGVVMAGNIPLVGFHDFLCVVISGHRFLGKLSSDDEKLLPAIADILVDLEPSLKDVIEFAEDKLEKFNAVIATGSNNTARYFDYYFGKYPNIIRKNRNGIAVLTGEETSEELKALGSDIFMYFGMGCRSISKLFVPQGYKFDKLFQSIEEFSPIGNHNKFRNNYDYYRSIYLINKVKHYDNGFLMLTEDPSYSSPPSVLYYEEYADLESLNLRFETEEDKIQCVVSNSAKTKNAIPLGSAQKPELWDYADGIDTMKFLISLFE